MRVIEAFILTTYFISIPVLIIDLFVLLHRSNHDEKTNRVMAEWSNTVDEVNSPYDTSIFILWLIPFINMLASYYLTFLVIDKKTYNELLNNITSEGKDEL